MSLRSRRSAPQRRAVHTVVFAALGDETRLRLVGKLSNGEAMSISDLSEGSNLTRQAVTKHLCVLENARLVHGLRHGRERRFTFSPAPFDEAKRFLEVVSGQWERALGRLKSFVESAEEKH
jgi:DNA-binding transcriptional ArsR family regulator